MLVSKGEAAFKGVEEITDESIVDHNLQLTVILLNVWLLLHVAVGDHDIYEAGDADRLLFLVDEHVHGFPKLFGLHED